MGWDGMGWDGMGWDAHKFPIFPNPRNRIFVSNSQVATLFWILSFAGPEIFMLKGMGKASSFMTRSVCKMWWKGVMKAFCKACSNSAALFSGSPLYCFWSDDLRNWQVSSCCLIKPGERKRYDSLKFGIFQGYRRLTSLIYIYILISFNNI